MFGPAALSILTPALLTMAVVVAPPVPGPDDACPSSRQVSDAMQARFPGALIAPEPSPASARPDALRSVLDVAGDGTVVRFSLIDARGETQLKRTLPSPGRGRPVSECLALADTLAVIVERYLGGITYDPADTLLPETPPTAVAPGAVPTAPDQDRGILALAGIGWRMPRGSGVNGGTGDVEGRFGVQVDLTQAAPRLSAALSLGLTSPLGGPLNDASPRNVTLRRFPFRLAALLELPAGPGWVEPTAEAVADLIVASVTEGKNAPADTMVGVGFGLSAAVGYRLRIWGPIYLRPRTSIGVALRRYDISVKDTPDSLFSSPRAYASFGIDTGFLFR